MKTTVARLSLVFVILIVISLMFVGINYAKIFLKSAAGIWFFNECVGDQAEDSSEKGNHGKVMNGSNWVKGKLDNALEFDGSNWVDCGNGASLSMGSGDFSVGAWVKPSTIGDYLVILTNGGPGIGAQKGYRLRIEASGEVQFSVRGDTEQNAVSEETVKAEDWWHVVGVKNSEKIKLYVNGEEWGSDDAPAGSTDNDFPLQIGRHSAKGRIPDCWYFHGLIDEVFIFPVALSLNDIKKIMNKGLSAIADVSPGGKLTTKWGQIKNDQWR